MDSGCLNILKLLLWKVENAKLNNWLNNKLIRDKETFRAPSEYLPKTYGITIHFIHQVDELDLYEFDFLGFNGVSIWNYIFKVKDYHHLMEHVIMIKSMCRKDVVILYLSENT